MSDATWLLADKNYKHKREYLSYTKVVEIINEEFKSQGHIG